MEHDDITSFEALLLHLGMVSGALHRAEFSIRLGELVRADPRIARHVSFVRLQLSAVLLHAKEGE